MSSTNRWKTAGLALLPLLLLLLLAGQHHVAQAFTPISIAGNTKLPSTRFTVAVKPPFSLAAMPTKSRQTTQLQMVSYDALMEKIPSQNVIKAADSAPNRKVTASGK
jgi:hypothetical protein